MKYVCFGNIPNRETSLNNIQNHKNILEENRERKEKPYKMFEEITVNATQMLVQLFWVILILILLWGLAQSKTQPRPRTD